MAMGGLQSKLDLHGYDISNVGGTDRGANKTCFRFLEANDNGQVKYECMKCNMQMTWTSKHGTYNLERHVTTSQRHNLQNQVSLGNDHVKAKDVRQIIKIVQLESKISQQLLCIHADLAQNRRKGVIQGCTEKPRERISLEIPPQSRAFDDVDKRLRKLVGKGLKMGKGEVNSLTIGTPQFIKRESIETLKKKGTQASVEDLDLGLRDGGEQGIHNDNTFLSERAGKKHFDTNRWSFWAPLQSSALIDFLTYDDRLGEFARVTVQIPLGFGVIHNAWHAGTDNIKMWNLRDNDNDESLRFFSYINGTPPILFTESSLKEFVAGVNEMEEPEANEEPDEKADEKEKKEKKEKKNKGRLLRPLKRKGMEPAEEPEEKADGKEKKDKKNKGYLLRPLKRKGMEPAEEPEEKADEKEEEKDKERSERRDVNPVDVNTVDAAKRVVKSQTPSYVDFIMYVKEAIGDKDWVPNSVSHVNLAKL